MSSKYNDTRLTPQLMNLYNEGLSAKEMQQVTGIGQFTIRRIFLEAGYKMKKKHRVFIPIPNQLDPLEEQSDTSEVSNTIFIEHKLELTEKSLQRSRDEVNYYKKFMRKEARYDKFYNTLEDIVEKLKDRASVDDTKVFNTELRQKAVLDYGIIVVLSDIHLGELVSSDDVPNNEYNYKVAEDRISKLIQETLMYHKQSRHLIIADLKDILKGVIHGGIYETEDSLIDSIYKAVDIYLKMLKVFSKCYETVTLYSTGSNHERVTENIKTTDKHLDYGRLIDMLVERTLKESGIKNVEIITTNTGYHLLEVNGSNLLLMHGDTQRSYNPTSDVSRSKLQDLCLYIFDKPYQHAISGHTHKFIGCHNQYGGTTIVNGTMVGNTSYGLQSGYPSIVASQTICFIGEEGKLEDFKALQF